jgi:hypothetical protein
VPFLFSGDDLCDIGKDYGAPVTEDYETRQGHFTGEISWCASTSAMKPSAIRPGWRKPWRGGLSHACHSEITGFNS